MIKYEKPVAVMVDSLSEGVYMASGAPEGNSSSSSGGVTYSLELGYNDNWNHVKYYNITFINNGNEKVDVATVNLSVTGTVNAIRGSVSGSISGSVATVSCNFWGNGLGAKSSNMVQLIADCADENSYLS